MANPFTDPLDGQDKFIFNPRLRNILGQNFGDNAFQRLSRILSQSNLGAQGFPSLVNLNTLQGLSGLNPTQNSFIQQILSLAQGGPKTGTVGIDVSGFEGIPESAIQRLQNIFGRAMANKQGPLQRALFGRILGPDDSAPVVNLTPELLQRVLDFRRQSGGGLFNDAATAFLQRVLEGNFTETGGNGGGAGGGGGVAPGGGGAGQAPAAPATGAADSLAGPGTAIPSGNPFLDFLMNFGQQALEGPFGFPQDILERARSSILSRLAQGEQQQFSNLDATLNRSGLFGSGEGATAGAGPQLRSDFANARANALLNLELQNAQAGLQDRNVILNFLSNLGGLANQRDISSGRLNLQQELGRGQLDLGNRQLDLQRLGLVSDLALRQFLQNLQLFFGGLF